MSPPAPVPTPTPTPAPTGGRRVPLWAWPLIAARIVLMLATLVVCLPLYYLAAPFIAHNPVPRWFLRAVAAIAGVRLRVTGPRPGRRTFLLANHVSWIDIPAIAGVTGSAFVGHDGLAQIAPLRWLCALNDTVFVARHDRASVAAQVEQVRTALADTGALTVFPEGTTSDGTGTLAFKSSLLSALEADSGEGDSVAVRPVWLDYGPHARDIAWVGSEPGLDNALRILARIRRVPLTVHFLPPLPAETRASRKLMATAARESIEAARRGE